MGLQRDALKRRDGACGGKRWPRRDRTGAGRGQRCGAGDGGGTANRGGGSQVAAIAWTGDFEVRKRNGAVVGDGVAAVQRGNRVGGNKYVLVFCAVDREAVVYVKRQNVVAQLGGMPAERARPVFGERNRDGRRRAADRLCAGRSGTDDGHQEDDQDGSNTEETQALHKILLLCI